MMFPFARAGIAKYLYILVTHIIGSYGVHHSLIDHGWAGDALDTLSLSL